MLNYFAQETTIKPSDIYILLVVSVIHGIFRTIIDKLILRPLSKIVNEKQREKFVNRGFDCLHYITSTLIGSIAFIQRPYAHCPYYFLSCVKYMGPTGDYFVCSILEKIYFMYFASYYFSDVCWLHTSSDWRILIFHHFVTISLILTCVIVARPVLGLSIMLLHDWVDIFLYCGKIATYIHKQKWADGFLYVFAGSFFWLRLFGCATIIFNLARQPWVQPHHVALYRFSCSCFVGLYYCHIHWGVQIIKAVIKILKHTEVAHDTRSDDSEEAPKPKAE